MFRRKSHHRSTGRALLALVTLIASLALTTVAADAIEVSSGVIGGFQVEGNEVLDVGDDIEGTMDWTTQVLAPDGTLSVITDDPADSGFTNGSKELKPSGWDCANGGANPGKADILKAFVNPRVSNAGVFLDLAFIRKTADDKGGNGDVHVNFEFNQANVAAPGTFVPGACPIVRATGDLLVTYDFPGGADAPSINVYRWLAILPVTDDAAGDWVSATLLPTQVAAAVNAGPIEDEVGDLGTLGNQQFGEASLDLTTILTPAPGQPACVSFGSANIRSRSSGESWTSSLQDKLPTTPIDFSTCGQIDLVKRSDTGQLLAGAKFQLYKSTDATLTDGEKVGVLCTTPATGVCSWDDLLPGLYYVVETEAPAGYSLDTDPTVGPINLVSRGSVHINGLTDVDGDNVPDGFSDYKWRYALNLTPDATNLVGTNHVFTATLTVQTIALGPFTAASSETLGILISGLGSIVSPGSTCVTDPNGQCAITIHSDAAGDSTLSVSFDDNTTTIAVDAGDTAVKHWINYDIDIAPDATNLVGTNHIFTVTVTRDAGSGLLPLAGAHPTVTIVSGPGSFSSSTCDDPAGTNASGQCTITLTSALTGTTLVRATYAATEETTSNTFSDDATKNWVNYDLVVNPDGINHAGQNHVFTVTLKRDTGSGLMALAGAGVQLAWSGTTGAITASLPAGATPLNSCTTDVNGQCSVTVSSAVTGSGTLTASWGILLGSGQLNKADSANKTWVDWDISITPTNKTNLVGTDHQFTVTVRYDNGGGVLLPLVGVKPIITLGVGSVGTIKDTNNVNDCDQGGTSALGTCTVTITSTVTGDTTVTATYDAVHATAANAFEHLTATAIKHWVNYALTVTPDGINHAGDDHVFTVRLVQLVDGLPVPMANQTVSLAWAGTGSILPLTCLTNDQGVCLVTASSDATGSGTLTAQWGILLDSGQLTLPASAHKTWVDWDISITPDDKTNLVGTSHQFTVKVRYDAGGGLGLQPLDVDDAVLLDIDGVGDISDTDCDQGTAADGTCTVTISSDDTGDSTVTASYHAVHATARNAFEDLTGAAVKHWVDYKVLVEPNAVNLVGDDHVFTVTVTRDDGSAAGFVPVANGNVQLAWSGGAGSGITAVSLAGTTPLNSCNTDEAGQCTVTVSSSTPLSGELTATYQTQLDSGTHSFSSNASKQWVNWTLSITPAQAENLVGTNHTFVVKVTHDAGAGGGLLPLAGAKPVINLAGLGTVTANTCTEGTNALGLCTVTITSAVPGTSTVSASFQAVLDQASISLQAQGSKLWVDYRLVVSPETAVNPINTTHILTVTLEKNIGNGFVPAPSQTVTLGLSGPGSITIVDAGTIGSALAGSCTTDAAGTCRVTITSPVAGLATLTATYDAKVGETSGSFTDSGNKLWEAPVIVAAVAPLQVLAAAEELPRTGAPIQSTLYGAMWLIGAGFVLCLIGRQRRRSNPSV